MRSRWTVTLVVWCIGLMLASSGSAYVWLGHDWSYQPTPMGENWIVCGTGMPGSGVQRTKDGAAGWNSADFTFTFGGDACSSGGVHPSLNNVNQVDFGGGLSADVLAESVIWYYTDNPTDTVECDMRFSSAIPWYTGTGTPPATQYDWWSVATHEMGHCLGLDEESSIANPKPVMYPLLAAGEVRRMLTSDDSTGRNAIYGGVTGPTWYILQSSTGQVQTVQFGWSAVVPVPGDYDGDGRTDIAAAQGL